MNEGDWAVEVDRLLSEGDPRGALALATPTPTDHRELSGDGLAAAIPLLGPIERPGRHRLRWHHGYFEHFGSWSSSLPDPFWHQLFAHESARFLRALHVRWIRPALLLELLETYRPPLEELHWNERDEPVDFDPFFAALPNLRHLHLWRPARLERGSVQPLKTLAVNTGENPGLDGDLVRWADAGGLDELEQLEIWGTSDLSWAAGLLERSRPEHVAFKGSIGGSIIQPLVESPAFQQVRHLTLEGFWPGDALIHLVRALEHRAPLASYTSSGQVPAPALVTRLRACARDCSIRP